jgi:hypothetical protein
LFIKLQSAKTVQIVSSLAKDPSKPHQTTKKNRRKGSDGKGKGVTYEKIRLYPNQSSAPNSEIIKDLARYGYIFWV